MESADEFYASNGTLSEVNPTCDDMEVSKEAVQVKDEKPFYDQVENSVENEKTDIENQLHLDKDLSYATSSDRNYFNSTTLTLISSPDVVNDFKIVLEKMHSLDHLAVSEENNTEMDDGFKKIPIMEKSACDLVELKEVFQLCPKNEEKPQQKGNDSKEIVNPETKSHNSTTSLHFCDHCDKKYTVERSLSRHKKKCHKTLRRKQSHLDISRTKGIVSTITPTKDESKDSKEITKRVSLRLPKPKIFHNYVSEVTRASRSTSKPLKEIDELKARNEEISNAKKGSTDTKLDRSLKPYLDEASTRLSKSKTNINTSENVTVLWRSKRIRKPKLKDFFPKETTNKSRPLKRKLEAKTDQENVSEKSLSGKRMKRSELECYSQSTNGIKKNTNVELKETNVLKDNETKNNERNLKNGDVPRQVTNFNMRGFSLRRSVRGPSMKFRRYETQVDNQPSVGARSKKLSGKINPQAKDRKINDVFRRVSNRAVKPAKFNEYVYATDSRTEVLPSIRKDIVKKVETPIKLVSKEGKNTSLKLSSSKRKNTTNKNRNLKAPTEVSNRIRKPKMLPDFVYSSNQKDDITSENSISQKNIAMDKRKTSKIEANAEKVKNSIPINATTYRHSLVTEGVKQSKAIDRSIKIATNKPVKSKLNQQNTQPFKVKTVKIKKTDSLITNRCPGSVSVMPKKRGRPRKPIDIEEILAKIKSQASRRKKMNESVTQRAFEVVKFESKSRKSTSRVKSHNRAYTKELLKDASWRRNCTDSLPTVKHAVARKSNPYQYRYFYDINMVKPMSIVIPKLDEVTFRKMLNKI